MTDLAPWRQVLARSLHRNRALVYTRYFQLATVRANGRPANRTVVFRGFLQMFLDSKSMVPVIGSSHIPLFREAKNNYIQNPLKIRLLRI